MTGQIASTSRRLKVVVLVVGLVLSGLVLLASTQEWFDLVLTGASHISVSGTIAAPALSVLALTGLALVATLSIAGPFFRAVLGSLAVFLGATVVLSSVLALSGPVATASALVTKATGVSGSQSIAALVTSSVATAWPFVAAVSGALLACSGIAVIATSRWWPASSRKYSATRFEAPDTERDAVIDWDALSTGSDPTAR